MHTPRIRGLVSLSRRYTDQGGKSSEGLFLVGHSASVVALAAHPLGQQVLTAQTRERNGDDVGKGVKIDITVLYKI